MTGKIYHEENSTSLIKFALFTRNLIFGLFVASVVITCLIGLGILWQNISGSFWFEMKDVKVTAGGDSLPIIIQHFLRGVAIIIGAICTPLLIIGTAMLLSDFGGALLEKFMSWRTPECHSED